jgi:hypothetical protein
MNIENHFHPLQKKQNFLENNEKSSGKIDGKSI